MTLEYYSIQSPSPAGDNMHAIADRGDNGTYVVEATSAGGGSNIPRIDYKFREDELIAEFKKYIDSTYSQHYSLEKFQALEFIFDGGHGEGFNVGNVLKYAQRYGKKGSRSDARKDMTKVLHYALLQLFLHDEETKRLENDTAS